MKSTHTEQYHVRNAPGMHILNAGSFRLVWTDSNLLSRFGQEFVPSFALCSLCSRTLISHFPPFDSRFSFHCHWTTFTTHYDKFGIGIPQHVSATCKHLKCDACIFVHSCVSLGIASKLRTIPFPYTRQLFLFFNFVCTTPVNIVTML